MSLETINPATGEFVRDYQAMTDDEVDDILKSVASTQMQWRTVPFAERARLMALSLRLRAAQVKVDAARGMSDAAQGLQVTNFWEYRDE